VDRSSASPSPQIVFDALDAAAKAGADRISFSGGEPTLHPRLVDYIGRARSLDIDGIEIQTNALRLTDPSLCDALVEAGLNKAVVSLHAVDPERYLRITGAGTPDEVMHGIRNLLDRGVRVEVNVVHCDDNLDHLQDIMERIADRIPEVLVLLSVTYIVEGVSRDWQKVAIRYTDAVPYLADALRSARERNLAIRLTGRCSVPPCAWHGRLEELQHVDIADVHQDDTEDGHVFFDTCNSCAARKHCYGISQDYVQNFGQEEFKAIPADLWQQVLGARD
jgi:molybdenum cofactor biosynthesis enzyme MoaA